MAACKLQQWQVITISTSDQHDDLAFLVHYSEAQPVKKLSSIPPNQATGRIAALPIIALAVPARAPCFAMASDMALGPVKPIPATTKKYTEHDHRQLRCMTQTTRAQ